MDTSLLKEIVPTEEGVDIQSADGKYDAHVRLERTEELHEGRYEALGGVEIAVDVFRSSVKDANTAHFESEEFPDTPSGWEEATDYLRDLGFFVRIGQGRLTITHA